MNQKTDLPLISTHAYRDIVLPSMETQSMVPMIQLQKCVSWIQSAKRSGTAHKMDLASFVTIWTENKITMIGSYVDSGDVSKIHFTIVSKIHQNTL